MQVWTLADTSGAGERDAANSWREPDRIRVVTSNATLAGGKLAYRFPPLSLVVLKAQRKPAAVVSVVVRAVFFIALSAGPRLDRRIALASLRSPGEWGSIPWGNIESLMS